MKRLLILFMLLLIIPIELMAAGYSIVNYTDTSKFMRSVKEHKKKYSEVLETESDSGFELYIYRLDFQIIAQLAGENHIGIVTGLTSEINDIKRTIEEVKRKITQMEGRKII